MSDPPDDDDLFSWALSRGTDPDTSFAAARSVDASVTRLENRVLRELVRSGERGCTLDELIDATGLDKVTVSPRLRPLCDKGFAYASEARRLGKSGRFQIVWRVTAPRKPA